MLDNRKKRKTKSWKNGIIGFICRGRMKRICAYNAIPEFMLKIAKIKSELNGLKELSYLSSLNLFVKTL